MTSEKYSFNVTLRVEHQRAPSVLPKYSSSSWNTLTWLFMAGPQEKYVQNTCHCFTVGLGLGLGLSHTYYSTRNPTLDMVWHRPLVPSLSCGLPYSGPLCVETRAPQKCDIDVKGFCPISASKKNGFAPASCESTVLATLAQRRKKQQDSIVDNSAQTMKSVVTGATDNSRRTPLPILLGQSVHQRTACVGATVVHRLTSKVNAVLPGVTIFTFRKQARHPKKEQKGKVPEYTFYSGLIQRVPME